MSSDLARTLVDAAAEAIHAPLCECNPTLAEHQAETVADFGQPDECYDLAARAAVAATLRALAAYRDPTRPPAHSDFWTRPELVALADRVEHGGER